MISKSLDIVGVLLKLISNKNVNLVFLVFLVSLVFLVDLVYLVNSAH